MAARILHDSGDSAKSRFIRDGLEGRTIFLPRGFLDRFDTKPGQLVETLTLALSAYLAQEWGAA